MYAYRTTGIGLFLFIPVAVDCSVHTVIHPVNSCGEIKDKDEGKVEFYSASVAKVMLKYNFCDVVFYIICHDVPGVYQFLFIAHVR